MARPLLTRKISVPPKMLGFKPFGIEKKSAEKIKLSFGEFESFILVSHEGLSQEEAAVRMEVSRPTLTRIYNKALQKIAKAFSEGSVLTFEGGQYTLEGEWYRCRKCHKLIEGLDNHVQCVGCPDFNKEELICLKKLGSEDD